MKNTAIDWAGVAFNQVPNSSNKIHSDQIAKDYGFKGGLVPGVTLSAYLAHPAIEAWGRDWLEQGYIHVKVESPVYEGNKFFVEVDGDESSYTADLISEGRRCAMAHVRLNNHNDFFKENPSRQHQGLLDPSADLLPATRDNMEKLRAEGCKATEFIWNGDHDMTSYFHQPADMPHLLNTTSGNEGLANLSFLLGCANRHFAASLAMSPWVHVETRSQNYKAVEFGSCLVSEMEIVDLFEKKGHEFADCEFTLFDTKTSQAVFSVWQRAIYKLRES